MIIKARRIKSLEKHFAVIEDGTQLILGVVLSDLPQHLPGRIGFSATRSLGETVLPAPDFGPISRYNAEGKQIIHREKPMETAYRQMQWHWEEFRGPYQTEPMSKIVDVPYQRYPRSFIEPPSIEFTIRPEANGRPLIASPLFCYEPAQSQRILDAVNLFLEIFGFCQVFTADLHDVLGAPIRRLNWRLLPRGERPWSQLKAELDPLLRRAKRGNQIVVEHRFKTINSYKPDFHAVGHAGFSGYVVFGFPESSTYILESIYTENATYVFGENWERLSKRTKAEILAENAQTDRLIHRHGWESKLDDLLSD